MIDGGPLRTSRPAGRQGIYQDEPVHYQPEQPPVAESATVMEQQQPRQLQQQYRRVEEPVQAVSAKRPKNLSWIKWVVAAVVVIGVGTVAWLFFPTQRSVEATIDTGKYQAIFLSNGQVYFGNLTVVDSDYMKLTNVYYLERQLTTSDSEESSGESDLPNNTQSNENNFQLLKYSDVLYGSEDAMVISRDDIIRYENLRPDGVVAKAIANRR